MKNLKFIIKILLLFILQPSLLLAEDIRELYVGAKITDIAIRGFTNFECQNSYKALKTWNNFATCKKGKNNLYTVKFEYDERFALNENFEGTQISGHPVLINIAIDDNEILQEINIVTDPKAPFYFRKQAHLLWLRVNHKYGSGNWTCNEIAQNKRHIKVGKTYVNKVCTKKINDKTIKIHREFYFLNDKTKKENLVSKTFLQIKKNNKL
jgi:hypothetical protein